MLVTKRFTFEAAHYLERADLLPSENFEHYHACSGFKGRTAFDGSAAQAAQPRIPHGHSYILEVTVKGPIGADGFVIDFKELKKLVNQHVIEKCDHELLNEVELFRGRPTTCENMLTPIAFAIQTALRTYDRMLELNRLRLWETADSYAEWTP
jgi:6-pyruvoyltetrahydropterin/6-carboxytetrahydropterin synthase